MSFFKAGIKPQKILLIRTLDSGKTMVAQWLVQETGFPYTSIDDCRIRHGDGSIEGEERAWEKILAICRKPAPGILEFCGMGPAWRKSGMTFSAPRSRCRSSGLCSRWIPAETGPNSGRKRSLRHSRGHRWKILYRSSTMKSDFPGVHPEPGITFSCNTEGISGDCFC